MRAAGICKASEERDTGMFVVGDVAGTAALLEVAGLVTCFPLPGVIACAEERERWMRENRTI